VSGRTVVDFDPRARCEQFRLLNTILYNQCLLEVGAAQPTDPSLLGTPPGGTIFRVPPQDEVHGTGQFTVPL